jgi:hypothetical protein
MARFKADEVDRYGGQGGGGYFSLKNDGDVAKIRFLYTGIDDVEGLSVHRVEIGDKKRYVNCLREYNDPVDVCPFCRERMFTTAKLFIPVYNIDEDKVQIWERGKKFFGKMSSLCSRYPNIVSHIFEIERNGKAGDTSTTYEPYEVGQDDTEIDDFEVPEVVGTVVLDKTAEDMEYFLDNGDFPSDGGNESPRRRNSGGSGDTSRRREEAPARRQQSSGRRTPARRGQGGSDEDSF